MIPLNDTSSDVDQVRLRAVYEKLAQRVIALEFSSTELRKRVEVHLDYQHSTSLQLSHVSDVVTLVENTVKDALQREEARDRDDTE